MLVYVTLPPRPCAINNSCLSTEEVGEKKRESVKSSSVFLNDQLKEGNHLLQDIDRVLLEKGTHEEILSLQNKIEENVKKVKDERPTLMKPFHDGNIQYKANPVDNIDTTSNLDKMGEVGKIYN